MATHTKVLHYRKHANVSCQRDQLIYWSAFKCIWWISRVNLFLKREQALRWTRHMSPLRSNISWYIYQGYLLWCVRRVDNGATILIFMNNYVCRINELCIELYPVKAVSRWISNLMTFVNDMTEVNDTKEIQIQRRDYVNFNRTKQ